MSEQRKFKIAIIPGEGIGKEVIQEGQRAADSMEQLNGCAANS